MGVAAIITAAGKGLRAGTPINKQFVEIRGKPLLYYTLRKFDQCAIVDEIVLVVPEEWLSQDIVNKFELGKIRRIVAGGKERQDSVYQGLKAVGASCDIVIIHDGVRPFVSTDCIERSVVLCQQWGAVVVAVPAKDTIKEVSDEGLVRRTLERTKLWMVQTPQVFSYPLILQAYEKAFKDKVYCTDDSALVERLGHPVKILEGDYENLKITSALDLKWANFILGSKDN